MSSPFVLAANWKMHKGPREAENFFSTFVESKSYTDKSIKTIFFPPSIDLAVAQNYLVDQPIGWGPQNIYFEDKGAFTGEISASMVADMGATHVLVGHSERRTLFNENNEGCAKKIRIAQSHNLTPILCVGETLVQRQSNETNNVLREQIHTGLEKHMDGKNIIIAYEPVWAIGTGEVATVEQVREAHEFIRTQLIHLLGDNGIYFPILYGGSVKSGNAAELAGIKQVGGFLVGSASLEVESFNDIIKASLQ